MHASSTTTTTATTTTTTTTPLPPHQRTSYRDSTTLAASDPHLASNLPWHSPVVEVMNITSEGEPEQSASACPRMRVPGPRLESLMESMRENLAKTLPSEDQALQAWLLVWLTGRMVTGAVHEASLKRSVWRRVGGWVNGDVGRGNVDGEVRGKCIC